jgi:hypothetical protein
MRRSTIFLLLIACTVFGTGLLANDIRYRGADTLLEVRKAKFAPVIDGVMDPIWRSVSETWMTSFGNGTSLPDDKADLYGSFKLMWDDNYIYGLLTTYDDVLFNGMTNSYENDSWEIYFDADNSKGTSYDGVNDCQLRFEWQKDVDGSGVDGTAPAALLADVQAGIELAQLDFDAGNGYMIEFAIPLEAIQLDAAAGTKFGLELQQNDNDGTARDHISKWWLQSGDASWNNASVFGTAVLSDLVVDTVLSVYKAPSAPVIDGVMDDVWKNNSVGASQTSYGNGTSLPYSRDDLTGDFRLMWDDTNIYGFFTFLDDIPFNGMTNSYENDSWEVYFDADNSKGTSYDGVNDCQLRIEWQKDVDGSGVDGTAPAALLADVQAGITIGQVDIDNGWELEFSIPVDAIQLDPSVDTQFGFETQQNDNDGTARDHISKWWLQSGDASWNNASVFGTAVLLGEIVTGVGQKPVAELKNYTLGQNYPNPFNPTTKITYSVAKTEKVKLAVYNLLGMQVAKLVDGVKSAGAYTVEFNARNLPSGVYFYKLETANQQLSKKMVFLK